MKMLEYEAKKIFSEFGIQVPEGFVASSEEEVQAKLPSLKGPVVIKAQVDVGGRGKAGGILMAEQENAAKTAASLLSSDIKGVPVKTVLVEEQLAITHEYYLSVTTDRSKKQPVILFAEAGGVDIEETAGNRSDSLRKATVPALCEDVPGFALHRLSHGLPKGIAPVINRLYHVFCKKDALLAEINPLVTVETGEVYAADAKLIIDDNALPRQGIRVNRDLTEREQTAESHGFSYVELEGAIGVVGNGAGLTMSTLDLIAQYGGSAANFLDVGGGAERARVCEAVRLVAGMPGVKVIVVNLLGGITRCDEVANGIVDAGITAEVIVRLAGTNEAEGRAILESHGYRMCETMEEAVIEAVEAAA